MDHRAYSLPDDSYSSPNRCGEQPGIGVYPQADQVQSISIPYTADQEVLRDHAVCMSSNAGTQTINIQMGVAFGQDALRQAGGIMSMARSPTVVSSSAIVQKSSNNGGFDIFANSGGYSTGG